MFDDVFGERLSVVQPAEMSAAETIVHTTMSPVMMLHIAQAFFMSRMKSRRTSRIEAGFEKPREIYIEICVPA